jgi:hypothetical protein
VRLSGRNRYNASRGHILGGWHPPDDQGCFNDEHRTKVMRLTAEEFIRRFLLHVLPKRFVRIRHYGLLAGRNVASQWARCRQLLGVSEVEQTRAHLAGPASRMDWARPEMLPAVPGSFDTAAPGNDADRSVSRAI